MKIVANDVFRLIHPTCLYRKGHSIANITVKVFFDVGSTEDEVHVVLYYQYYIDYSAAFDIVDHVDL